ncbi:MAG: acyl-CoA synthetase FdrA, partial [Anaerolineales bacterium]|nr:acyl-CoA synthetase FdrA [Anaerolineales bacterium]
ANLVLISVPGDYAAAEAHRALDLGLHVMLFSDNVSLDDEVELKKKGCERGLLVMGPDCGTAIVNQVGLGFANIVKRGPVGIVGASGTGIQEISVLLDRLSVGISHAIGTGGRDLYAAVGGATMLMGLELLAADDDTKVIVLTSKPPDAAVSKKILEKAVACSKPVVVNFLGGDPELAAQAGLAPARTLEEAAVKAAGLAIDQDRSEMIAVSRQDGLKQLVSRQVDQLKPGQQFMRGLYTGGTLCYEAMLVLNDTIGDVYSNIPLKPEYRLQDSWRSCGHTLVDLGDDEFTRGRAHPMIDPTLRNQRLILEAQDPETAVILMDVVLGYGSHPDPAGELAATIKKIRDMHSQESRYVAMVASVCGTDADPQEFSRQKEQLENAGVVVASSNAEAAAITAAIAAAVVQSD